MRKHEVFKRIEQENHSPTRKKRTWARRLCAAGMAATMMVGSVGAALAADEPVDEAAAADASITEQTETEPEEWTVEEGMNHIPEDADVEQTSTSTQNPDGTTTDESTSTTTWETTTTVEPSATTTVEGDAAERPEGTNGTVTAADENGNELGVDQVASNIVNDYLAAIEAGLTNKVETTESETGTITESGTHTETNSTTTEEDGFVSGSSSNISGSLSITEDKVHTTDKEETDITITDHDPVKATDDRETFDAVHDEGRQPATEDSASAEISWERDPQTATTPETSSTDIKNDVLDNDLGIKVEVGKDNLGTVTFYGEPSGKDKLDVLKDLYKVVTDKGEENLEITVGGTKYTFDGTDLKLGEETVDVSTVWTTKDADGNWTFRTNSDNVHAYKQRQEAVADLEQTKEVLSQLQPGCIVSIGDKKYTVSAGETQADGTAAVVLKDADGNVLDTTTDEGLRNLWTPNKEDGSISLNIKAEYANPLSVTNISVTMSREPNDKDTQEVLSSLNNTEILVNGEKIKVDSIDGKKITGTNEKGEAVSYTVDWKHPSDAEGAQNLKKWELKWTDNDGTEMLVNTGSSDAEHEWAFPADTWEVRDPQEGDEEGTVTYIHKETGEEITVKVTAETADPIKWADEWLRKWEHTIVTDGEQYVDFYTIPGSTSYMTKAEWEEIYNQIVELQRMITMLDTTLTVTPDGFTRLDGKDFSVSAGKDNGIVLKTREQIQKNLQTILNKVATITNKKQVTDHLIGATKYDSSKGPGSQVGSDIDKFGVNSSSNGVVIQSTLIMKENGEENKNASEVNHDPQAWLREVINGDHQKMWVYCVGKKVGVTDTATYDMVNVKDLVLRKNDGTPLMNGDEYVTAGDYHAAGDSASYADHLEYIATKGYWGDLAAVKSLILEDYRDGLDDGIALAVTQAALWRFTNGLHASISADDITFDNLFGYAWTTTGGDGNAEELDDDEKDAAVELYRALVTGTLTKTSEKPTDIITEDDVLSVAINVKDKLDKEGVSALVEKLNNEAAAAANPNLSAEHVQEAMDAAAAIGQTSSQISGEDKYLTDLSITIAVVPDQMNSENMTVLVYQGSTLVAEYKLDSKAPNGSSTMADGVTTGTAGCTDHKDGTSTWTLENIVLTSGIPVNIKLQGTQKLGGGAYLMRTDLKKENLSQPFVGLAGDSSYNNVALDMKVNFDVQNETSNTHKETSAWSEMENAVQDNAYKVDHWQNSTVEENYRHDVEVTTTITHTTNVREDQNVFLAVWGDESKEDYERPTPTPSASAPQETATPAPSEPVETPSASTPAEETPSTSTPTVETPADQPDTEVTTVAPGVETPEVIDETGPQQNTLGEMPELPQTVNPAFPEAPTSETLAEMPEFPEIAEETTLTTEGPHQETLAEEPEFPSASEIAEELTLKAEQESTPVRTETEPEIAILRTSSVAITDEQRRQEKRTPKTGDESFLSFWKFLAFAAIISIIGLAGTLFSSKKKNENV